MDDQDHARLLRVSQQWERMYGELFVKAQRLVGENAQLNTALDDALTCLDAAQESAWGICLETDKYRFGRPEYDMTWDHVWELANNIADCATNAHTSAGDTDGNK